MTDRAPQDLPRVEGDRLLPAEPGVRAIAHRLDDAVRRGNEILRQFEKANR